MQWTTEKIRKFAEMKAEGYSLSEIADELGCTYTAAQTQGRNIKRAQKKAEAAKVTEVTEVTEVMEPAAPVEAPTETVDTPTETEAPIDTPTEIADTPTETIDTPTETPAAEKAVSRADILDSAKAIVTGEREKQYGKPEDNFAAVAQMWEVYLSSQCVGEGADVRIAPEDVAMMMVLLKVGRLMTGDYLADNYVDICGYVACAGEIAGKGATASVQTAGDAENENMSKCSGEKNGAQRAE